MYASSSLSHTSLRPSPCGLQQSKAVDGLCAPSTHTHTHRVWHTHKSRSTAFLLTNTCTPHVTTCHSHESTHSRGLTQTGRFSLSTQSSHSVTVNSTAPSHSNLTLPPCKTTVAQHNHTLFKHNPTIVATALEGGCVTQSGYLLLCRFPCLSKAAQWRPPAAGILRSE